MVQRGSVITRSTFWKKRCTTDTSSQRTHDEITTSLLRQNDVATPFWRNNDVIITPCVRWDSLPIRARYGVSFLSSKSDLCSMHYLMHNRVIMGRVISGLDCSLWNTKKKFTSNPLSEMPPPTAQSHPNHPCVLLTHTYLHRSHLLIDINKTSKPI